MLMLANSQADSEMDSPHISDHDLERYCLGMIVHETELAPLEEHLLACPSCASRAQAVQEYIDALRRCAEERRTGSAS